jgi:hypothetical protein
MNCRTFKDMHKKSIVYKKDGSRKRISENLDLEHGSSAPYLVVTGNHFGAGSHLDHSAIGDWNDDRFE